MTEREIFIAAFQKIDWEDRKRYLDQTCGHDALNRQRIEHLLELADSAGHFLEQPVVSQPVATSTATNTAPICDQQMAGKGQPFTIAGNIIANRYTLLEEIGDGGMGTVWMAEQSEPVRRQVALKLIKPGMDSKPVLVRFEAERQALAVMDHPNIAKVFDAGTTAEGRPFFVMELVKGIPVTKYCDEHKLTPRQRLELFVPVCQAIQHAHQKGIIHRDIKPSNVLVAMYDDRPVPKVIDFGVAKATGTPLTEQTLQTSFGAVIGTVEYMSPEQASFNQLDVDTRSDIYSLGVLLYELITGTTPLTRKRAKGAALMDVLRLVREEEPPKPSTRLSEMNRPSDSPDDLKSSLAYVAAFRHTEPAVLTKLVRGDLDWIVMKSLEKDRSRRYETANGFAMDVQRFLADEAVMACPPTAGYRFRKFAKRNRRSLAVTAVFTLSLLVAIGAVAGSLGWVARGQAARQLVLEHEIVQALEETGDGYKRGKLSEAMAALRRAEGLLGSGKTSDGFPQRVRRWRTDLDLVARLDEIRLEVSATKDDHFDWAAADPAYRDAFRGYGLDILALDPIDAASRLRASAIHEQLVASLDDWVQANSLARLPGTDHLLAVARAADPDVWRDRLRDAFGRKDAIALADLARDERILDQQPETLLLLVSALRVTNQRPLAIDVLRRAQPHHPADFWIYSNLGLALMEFKPPRADEAVAYYRAAVALRPESVGARLNLGKALIYQGDFARAEAECRKAIALNPNNAHAHAQLGVTLQFKGDRGGALAALQEAIRLRADSADVQFRAGIVYRGLRMFDEAAAAHREAIRLRPDDSEARINLGIVLGNQGQPDAAIAAYREALRLDPDNPEPRTNIAAQLLIKNQLAEAEAECREVLRRNPEYARAHFFLGRVAYAKSNWDDAIAHYGKSLERDPKYAHAHVGKAMALDQKGLRDLAIDECRTAIRVKPELSWAHGELGYLLACKGLWDESIAARREALRVAFNKAPWITELANTLHGVAWYLIDPMTPPQARNPNRAIELAKEAVSLTPKNRDCWNVLGVAYQRANKPKDAIAAFERCMALRTPENNYGSFSYALALWDMGNKVEAQNEYEYVVEWCHNSDAWNESLHLLCLETEEKLGIFTAYKQAVLESPHSAKVHCRMGRILLYSKLDATAAIPHLQEAIRLDPKLIEAHFFLGRAYEVKTSWREAAAAFQNVVQLQPTYRTAGRVIPILHGWAAKKDFELALALAHSAQWAKAAASFARGLELKPDDIAIWNRVAVLRLDTGDAEGYRRTCQEMFTRFGQTDNAEIANWLAWTCSLAPDSRVDRNRLVPIAERAVNVDAKNESYGNTLGCALFRAGRFEDAAKRLAAVKPSTVPPAYTWYLLAMTHHRLGHADEAKQWLAKARTWTEQEAEGKLDGPAPLSWDHRLTLGILRREAEKLIGANE